MTDHPIHEIDDDIHQRVRLGILAALIGLTRADFAYLKRELAVTDGNLGRHLEVLRDGGFVKLTREKTGSRPRTWISITSSGKKALREEVNALRRIMSQIDNAELDGPSNSKSATEKVEDGQTEGADRP